MLTKDDIRRAELRAEPEIKRLGLSKKDILEGVKWRAWLCPVTLRGYEYRPKWWDECLQSLNVYVMMLADTLPTEYLREKLAKNGVSNPDSYEWCNGEALYLGEPIAGRATENERRAILATAQKFSL